MDKQVQSSETIEVTTSAAKEDKKVSWGINEVREYLKEEDSKGSATRHRTEDDVNMIDENGGYPLEV